MKEILSSWKDSLSLLKPSSLKLLGLVTLNAWVKAWRVGWMFVLPPLLIIALQHLLTRGASVGMIFMMLAVSGCFFIAAARPSIGRKDAHYFALKFNSMWLILIIGRLIVDVGEPLTRIFLVWMELLPLLTFFILFLFDSEPSLTFTKIKLLGFRAFLKAIRNTLVLVVHTLPLLLVGFLVQILALFAGAFVLMPLHVKEGNFIVGMLGPIYLVIVASLLICFWVNVYIKRIHDQPSLYI
jgi:hypothetical protein